MKTLALASAAGAALLSLLSLSPKDSAVGAADGNYTVDPVHSSVIFSTRHLGVSRFYGRFDEVEGQIELNEQDLAQSRVSIQIPAESIDTNSPNRDGHLKSPDFFSAKEFPLISFESEEIRGEMDAFEVQGKLTMHGVTRPVTAKASFVGSGDTMFEDFRSGFEARFTVRPSAFGFAFMRKNPELLGPEVEIIVSLECVRQ